MKARILGSIALLLLVWPFAHRYLVHRYDVNPWELWGIAMYCTPNDCHVAPYVQSMGAGRLTKQQSMERSLPHGVNDFRRVRSDLGRFHSPDDLARAVLEARPSLDEIEIVVTVTRLDGKTAMIQKRKRYYRYRQRR